MNYIDGGIVNVGDKLWLATKEFATVVLSIDTHQDTIDYPLKDWKILKEGILVQTERGVLIAFHGENLEDFWRALE